MEFAPTLAALRHARPGRCAFIDYDALPEMVFSKLLEFFGVNADPDEVRRMRDIAQLDAKDAGSTFHRRRDERLSDNLAHLAAKFLDQPYAALRAAAMPR